MALQPLMSCCPPLQNLVETFRVKLSQSLASIVILLYEIIEIADEVIEEALLYLRIADKIIKIDSMRCSVKIDSMM